MLHADKLTYTYPTGTEALRGVSLTLHAGMIVYLLGRNGSGKSTLMNCLSGAITPTSGSIALDGVDLGAFSATDRARRIGLIPQMHAPAFAYTVHQMILMGRAPHLALFGAPSKHDHAIADEALASVGLTRYRDRAYTQLSGGERQLVLIARGLAQQCAILLMDEPDAHLDLNNQQRVMEIVARLAQTGVAFIVASHHPNNALIYADHVLLLKDGRALTAGDPARTLTAPLLSAAYDLDVEVITDGDRARAILPRKGQA